MLVSWRGEGLHRLHHGEHEKRHALYRRDRQPGRPHLAAQDHVDPKSFTARYKADRLVWYEVHEDPISAIQREKRIKDWKRDWKKRLIAEMNPTWRDLAPDIADWF